MGKRRESLLNFNALVKGVFFVDLKLSQNPYMPTTNQSKAEKITCSRRQARVNAGEQVTIG